MVSTELSDTDQAMVMALPGEGYHQCWYPVALSESIPPGGLVGMEFCDDRIVVYRGEDGVAHAVIPYCKHMGSDLSVGAVVGNDLRCAFHHWQYGPDGACTKIASGDRIPGSARLTVLPTEERRGLIWVFLGLTPLYPVPDLVEWDPETIVCRAMEVPFPEPLRVDPWIFASNAFDYQHLRVLHNTPIDADAASMVVHDYGIDSAFIMDNPHAGRLDWNIKFFGTNCLISYGTREGRLTQHIGCGTPMGSQGSKFFLVLTAPAAGVDDRSTSDVEGELDLLAKMHTQLFLEDLPVMNTLRAGRTVLVKSDRTLARYLRYARDYPRTTLCEIEREAAGK
jgi:phenylpropionate dioxygenase-like ring-hydroxylating dioxygenase large terminal subunit